MRPLLHILPGPGGFLLLMAALLLAIGQTAVFLISLREKRSRRQSLAAALHLLLGFLLFVLLLDSYDFVRYPQIPRSRTPGKDLVSGLPWGIFAALEGISAGVLALQLRGYRRYLASTLTHNAIRQTVDLLPEGICVSAPEGTVLLSNLKMNALCRELTGERLASASRLWTWLEAHGEDQGGKRLVHSPQGETWLFALDRLAADGREYRQTSAVNVTLRYRITEELREKNAHLRELQRRMREAAELSGEMFVKQETANARAALHNELGQVLLMGRHCIEHPESTDRGMVALMTRQMNRFLLGEERAPATEESALAYAVRLADSIGVTVELTGTPPRGPEALELFSQAIRECAANTVKHAEGDRLYARSSDGDQGLQITITNNGKPPKGPIAESGGLLALRRGAEAAGGSLLIQSVPRFSLTLRLPKSYQ